MFAVIDDHVLPHNSAGCAGQWIMRGSGANLRIECTECGAGGYPDTQQLRAYRAYVQQQIAVIDDLLQEAWGDVAAMPAGFIPIDERARAPYARTCDGCALYREQRRREQTLEAVRAIWRRQTGQEV